MLHLDFLKTLVILSSLPVAFVFTKIVITFSRKINFVNKPNPIVDSHKFSVPYGGGICIGSTIIVFLLLSINTFLSAGKILILLLPVIIAGLLDDIFKLKPLYKLAIEIISVSPFLFFFLGINISYYSLIICLLFIVVSQNAWNLIDIIDGLTAGVTFIIFSSLALILSSFQIFEFYAFLSAITASSTLGFRLLNKHPAKIFLGEAGSLLLGTLFAIIVVHVHFSNPLLSYFLALLGIVPFFELIFLVVVRVKKGLPFYLSSPDHFALRMLNNGFTVKSINTRVLLFNAVHCLIIIMFCFSGLTVNHFVIYLIVTIISAIIAFLYFQSLPPKIVTYDA